jgi:hypothetical protein
MLRRLRNPELLVTLAITALYLGIFSGRPYSFDGIMMYRQAQAIVFAHSLHFHPQELPGLEAFGLFAADTSFYGIGLSLLYVPGLLLAATSWPSDYVIARGAGAPSPFDTLLTLYENPLYATAAAPVHVLVTAASVYLVARLVRDLGYGRRAALWGMALYGLGSPALIYSRTDYSQPLTGLCWIGAFYAAVRFRRTGRLRLLWICGVAVFYAVLTRPVEGALLVPAILWLVALQFVDRGRAHLNFRATAVVLASFGLGVLATLAINYARFGSPWTSGYPAWATWSTPLSTGLPGALFSPGRGILLQFPAIVLVPVGTLLLWRHGHRSVAVAVVALPIVQLLNVATWVSWGGGSNWGLRLFVPALPLLAVPAAIGVEVLTSRWRRWLPPLLLVAGITYGVPAILSDIYNGYGGLATHRDVWQWYTYPPFGIWGWGSGPEWGLEHWLGNQFADAQAADIYWFRIANATSGFSLLVPYYLALAAAALAWYALRRRPGVTRGDAIVERHGGEPSTVSSGQGVQPRAVLSTRDEQKVGAGTGT